MYQDIFARTVWQKPCSCGKIYLFASCASEVRFEPILEKNALSDYQGPIAVGCNGSVICAINRTRDAAAECRLGVD